MINLGRRGIVPIGQTGVSTLYTSLGHHARLPENPAQQIQSRGQGLPESPSAGLARVGFTRNESLSAFYGRRFIAG